MSETFYLETLYPLQDSVLHVIDSAGSDFYLTGDTALSRCYLQHRYSDDLDFFVNDLPAFQEQALRVQKKLDEHFFVEVQRTGERFRRLVLFPKGWNLSRKGEPRGVKEAELKVEFINDVPFHFGDIKPQKHYSKFDTPLNILSNKITAIVDRDEAKDFADIFAIAEYLKDVDWKSLFVSASSKSAGIFAPLVAERIDRSAFDRLSQIKWNAQYNWKQLTAVQQNIVRTIVGLE
ncbi:MAG: nucleotidyl transferase AbiEii/AbiGii toxin family protein [Bacteroidota bacterium]|nr:nucleotidyl transferase AbiEii/AbiGii toxin family protein [Bacteroidota bacterium]